MKREGSFCLRKAMKRLRSWREAKGPVVCHASELLQEFGTFVKWTERFDEEVMAIYSLLGIEPARVRANLLVGKFKGIMKAPRAWSASPAVRDAYSLEYEFAMVVEKKGRLFVEPAVRYEEGFAVIEEPLKVAREISEEIGYPVTIVKEVPFGCCWLPAPLAWTFVPFEDAGLGEVPKGYSTFKYPITEGCWEVEEEVEEGEGEGFEVLHLHYASLFLRPLVKLRALEIKLLRALRAYKL